jgi:hypothetical protein
MFQIFWLHSQGQNLALAVVYVPYSLDSGGWASGSCLFRRLQVSPSFVSVNLAHMRPSRSDSGLGFSRFLGGSDLEIRQSFS